MYGYLTILSIFLSLHLGLLVYLSGNTNSKIKIIIILKKGREGPKFRWGSLLGALISPLKTRRGWPVVDLL